MSKYVERAKELRATIRPHYNCAQAVVMPFAEAAGLTEEQACQVAANFGGGMRMGSVCGAITGGLMVLGLFGVEDSMVIRYYYQNLRDNHENYLDCANLLRINKENGGDKKSHCDDMVYECVELVEKILRDQGKLND